MTQRYYRARLVGAGPFVPVKVWHGLPFIDGEEVDRSPRWQALVGLETTGRAILMGDDVPVEVEGCTLRNLEPIAEHDYRFMVDHQRWAQVADPAHPKANPKRAINFNTVKLPF